MSTAVVRAGLLPLFAGLVLWSSAFVLLYAALSVGCAFGWEEHALGPLTLQRGVLVALWTVHLAALLALLAWTRSHARRVAPEDRTGRFLARCGIHATVVALAATVINYAPVLVLDTCL